MGHEERERKFEQALARHLRGDGDSARDEAEARAAVPDAGAVECPDAGTLAAFHESTLSNEELNTTTEHIATCSRCQQILLLLEATDEIPLQVEAENDLKMGEPVLSAGAPHAAAQTPNLAGQTKPAMKTPTDISRGRGFKALRWAAPAGAIAAGLLIWFVVRDNKVQTLGHVDNVQVAQEQPRDERLPAPPPLAAPPAAEPATKTRRLIEPRKDSSRIKPPAEESGALRAPENSPTDSISSRVEHGARAESPNMNAPSESRDSGDYALRMGARDKSPETSSRQADVAVTAAAPTPEPATSGDARAQSAAPAAKADAKQSANTNQTVETQSNLGIRSLPTEQVVAMNQLETARSLKKDSLENAKIILAPKGAMRWRLLSEGRIERSSDGGATWEAQNSGVNVELLAGSAPSEAVCWIVGRGGTILKTADGGSHWSKVVWPITGEISGIYATDAMHAVVYDGTVGIPVRFATNDGGATWFRTNK
jgi:hypothetical protein